MPESFWSNAANALPPQVRWRYAKLFKAAEEYEQLLELAVAAGGHARLVLAGTCLGTADALRRAARLLDVAARRLTLTR